MMRALLVIWSLDPSGAGTATTELFDSLDAACAETSRAPGGECYGFDGGTSAVVWMLGRNHCTIARTDGRVATWVCKGRTK